MAAFQHLVNISLRLVFAEIPEMGYLPFTFDQQGRKGVPVEPPHDSGAPIEANNSEGKSSKKGKKHPCQHSKRRASMRQTTRAHPQRRSWKSLMLARYPPAE